MRTFKCACGERVFFDNTRCLTCQRALGFLPDQQTLSALEPGSEDTFTTPHGDYRKCSNYADQGVCNWMVPAVEPAHLCQACRLNNVIPDLSNAENRMLWAEVEKAKRWLIYSLNRLGLPLVSKQEDPEHGLAFDIKADTGSTRVLTGHNEGLITLNLAEADVLTREKVRVSMKERYRTLLGHFRHEVGHYCWERLVRDGGKLDECRALFGDDTLDYAEALKKHYASEPEPGWNDLYISLYARAHPWEDWAESFAHYLHMIDTLETAQHFGLTHELPTRATRPSLADFSVLMHEWTELTIALNALNRSMGLADAYPFTISREVAIKLELVHRVVRSATVRDVAEQPAPS